MKEEIQNPEICVYHIMQIWLILAEKLMKEIV